MGVIYKSFIDKVVFDCPLSVITYDIILLLGAEKRMKCPKCGKILPENINSKIKFCIYCGEELFEEGEKYTIQINVIGARSDGMGPMLVFVDDKEMFETKIMDNIYIQVPAGFHEFKFRKGIRSKSISLLINSNFMIRATFNTLSGLIDTKITMVTEDLINSGTVEVPDFTKVPIAKPAVVSFDGAKTFDVMLGDDDPEFDFNTASGLTEGILRVFSNRLEFISEGQYKKETLNYENIVGIRRKMGSVDIQCEGNVHKIYSIPKDIYNDVLAYLTNRISEVKNTK